MLTGALDTMDAAFIIKKDSVCVFENTGFRRMLGVGEDYTLIGRNNDDMFDVIFDLSKASTREMTQELRVQVKAGIEKR